LTGKLLSLNGQPLTMITDAIFNVEKKYWTLLSGF